MPREEEPNLKVDIAVMQKDIENIRKDISELKDLLIKLEDRYVTKTEFAIVKWIGGLIGTLAIGYIFSQFLK